MELALAIIGVSAPAMTRAGPKFVEEPPSAALTMGTAGNAMMTTVTDHLTTAVKVSVLGFISTPTLNRVNENHSDFEPLQVVLLSAGMPEHGIPANSHAVVLERHEQPYVAYEIEVVDEEGRTLFLGAVDPAAIEPWGSS